MSKHEPAQFTAWVTKYALSSGIIEMEVRDCFDVSKTMVMGTSERWKHAAFHNGEWHLSLTVAVARAEEMRTARIASLRKQIAKLEKLRFGDGGNR